MEIFEKVLSDIKKNVSQAEAGRRCKILRIGLRNKKFGEHMINPGHHTTLTSEDEQAITDELSQITITGELSPIALPNRRVVWTSHHPNF